MNGTVLAIGSHFGTSFDTKPTKVSLPAVIVGGLDPTLDLADGLTRSRSIVGRFHDGMAILGLSVEANRRLVRVSLRLDADGKTGPTPRLIELRGPGGESSLAVIDVTYRGVEGREPADVSVVVSTDDLPVDGLLVVEVREAPLALPAWAGRICSGGPSGFQLFRVRIDPIDVVRNRESAPTRQGPGGPAGAQLRSGLLVVQSPPPPQSTGVAERQIVLEPRLVPPWRRNRWAAADAPRSGAPGSMASAVDHSTTVPTRSTERSYAVRHRPGLAARSGSAFADLRVRAIILAGKVVRHGRPIVARWVGRLDRIVPEPARYVATSAIVRWLAGRRAIETHAASLTSGAEIQVEVRRHGGSSMTLLLRADHEPVLLGLRIKSGAWLPVRMAAGLILWSVRVDPSRAEARDDG